MEPNTELTDKIRDIVLTHHRHVEGEYGCPGESCPRVRQLMILALECAMASLESAEDKITALPTPK